MEQVTTKRRSKFKWKSFLAILIVLASLATAGFFWNDARQAKQQTVDAVANRNKEETNQVVSSLKTVLFVDEKEEPTVARIEDPSVLQKKNPDFYKNTQVGDYLVLYPKRAIIYRPDEKQIINIAPIINTDQVNKQATDQTPATTEPSAPDQPQN